MFATKYGPLRWTVGKFGELLIGVCWTCQLPTANLCVPYQCVFWFRCPVNFHFNVKPFGTDKLAPPTKISMRKHYREAKIVHGQKPILN